jgi:hypothetical protein
MRLKSNREICADVRRLFNRATRAIKRFVILLVQDKKYIYIHILANKQNL